MKARAAIALSVVALVRCLQADIIPAGNVVPWVPGVTVGVRGGIPAYPVWTNVVTGSYAVDNTGATDVSAAIVQAWADCPANYAVYIPAGIYRIYNGLTLTGKSGQVLRGAGSNTVFVGSITVNATTQPESSAPAVTNLMPVAVGATNITLTADPALFSPSLGINVGDLWKISGDFQKYNDAFPVGGVSTAAHTLYQVVRIESLTQGTNLTVWPPIVFPFTNNPVMVQLVYPPSVVSHVGLEHFTDVSTNAGLSAPTPGTLLNFNNLSDSWIYDVSVRNSANNYLISMGDAVCCQVDSGEVAWQLSVGTSHAPMFLGNCSGCLVQNNMFHDCDQSAILFNGGMAGNVFFANFFTNVYGNGDAFNHSPHPVMNLFEANLFCYKVEHDGTGSESHHVYLRNAGNPWGYQFKRFTSYMSVVGCVIPPGTGYQMCYQRNDAFNYAPPYPVFELGMPNLGNNTAFDFSPPVDMWWPGTNTFYPQTGNTNLNNGYLTNNGVTVVTNTILNCTNIPGDFQWLQIAGSIQNTPLLFQDAANTNYYWPGDLDLYQIPGDVLRQVGDGSVFAISNGTATGVAVGHVDGTPVANLTVSNGWRVWIGGTGFFQHMMTNLIPTHTISGNLVYTNGDGTSNIVWDSRGQLPIPDSLVYPKGPNSWPSLAAWWGTNRWPAIDVTNTPAVAPIPAELRFFGQSSGTNPPQPQAVAWTTNSLPAHVLGVMQ